LFQLQKILTRNHDLKTIVDMPSHGAKAAGSLYSVGFGHTDCNITLINPEMEMMAGWKHLGLEKKIVTVDREDVYNTRFADNTFDLAFNFVTWTELADPLCYLQEMKRISSQYVLLVTCNNFQPGYPWHRFLHWWFGFPWTHGKVRYNHITTVKKLFKTSGLNVIESGTIDSPCWPDHTGPRDVRLHRKFGSKNEEQPKTRPQWEVPFLEYVRTGNYPGWMKLLGKWDIMFRKGVFKLPMSHLFYVLGRKS
jgi:hypothetical protein